MGQDKVWVWGISQKKLPAHQEALRVLGMHDPAPDVRVQVPVRLDEMAVRRLPWRRRVFPEGRELLQFGAPDLRATAGGLVVRKRERHTAFCEVVIEDHGIGPGFTVDQYSASETLLFFGGDAVTLNNFTQFRPYFQLMREAFAPEGRLILAHCYAFSDDGRLALRLSEALGRPVVGMKGPQTVGDFAVDGAVYEAFGGRVRQLDRMSPWVLHFE